MGHVEGQPNRRQALVDPLPQPAAAVPDHPFADRSHQARLLRHRDELRRRDRAPLRVLPAQKPLDALDQAGAGVDHRLEEQPQLAVAERRAQTALQLELLDHPVLHEIAVEAARLVAPGLGVTHRDLGALQEGVAEIV